MTGPIVYVQNADGIFFKLAEGKGTNDAVIHLANQDQGPEHLDLDWQRN